MKILLTGASSFTGFWFAKELARAGHDVVAPITRPITDYAGTRGQRIALLSQSAEIVESCPFGSEEFIACAARANFDLLCHHAACVTGYRSQAFDISKALSENTNNLPQVLDVLKRRGLAGMVMTGSFFEPDEGAGSEPLRAFSPYGVSKALTASVIKYWCEHFRVPLGKFVIPNPFGPWEEERFCAYLVRTWEAGETAQVRTPDYVRDNIHVDLLARAYCAFVQKLPDSSAYVKLNPSGYIESQGDFARRFATEMGPRLLLHAEVELLEQSDFSEPMARFNNEPVLDKEWDEQKAWDCIAEYYLRKRSV